MRSAVETPTRIALAITRLAVILAGLVTLGVMVEMSARGFQLSSQHHLVTPAGAS